MEVKNKELKKLFDVVEPYYDMVSLPSVMTSFMACDDAIEDEIAALKAELTDAKKGRTIFRHNADNLRVEVLVKSDELRKANNQIDELKEKLNNERKHGEDLADVNGQLASENVDLKNRLTLWEHSRITWRARAQHAEKEVEDLNKKIHELEEENANLRVTPFDTLEALKKENSDLKTRNEALSATCENSLKAVSEARKEVEQYKKSYKSLSETVEIQDKKIEEFEADINTLKKKIHELKTRNENLERSNGILRGDNETLWSRLEEADLDISKRPWHGDGNAMTSGRTCCESLADTIEFHNKKNEEHKENVDLSYGHEFEFGDEVFVPWSDAPYMYIKSGLMYNTRTERLVYVGKDRHLKWFGDKFSIV